MSRKELVTDVLIVGAGPTGLMAANQLKRFGINFIIIDSKSGPTRESRAIAVTARSLEIYQQMNLSNRAIKEGKRMKSFNLYSNGKRRAEVKIGEIGKGMSEFSFMLAFEQSKNEEILTQNLIDQGGQVHWHHEFIELKENQDSIIAEVLHNGENRLISAQYLIACDGASSPVRTQLNFSFKGGTYDHKFFVADALINWDLAYDKLLISPGDKNFCAFLPLNGERGYRVLGTLPLVFADREDITFSDIESVVIQTIGIKITFEEVNWFSIYKLHHRSVDHFKEGRVFLAGDSAHIHSPAGGQGMNTGLQDAYNLCWKLSMVLRNKAKPSLLDTYNEERLPFAKWLINFTDRGFTMMTSNNWFIKFFRQHFALRLAGLVLKFSFFRPFIFKTLAQIGYSHKGRSLSESLTTQKLSINAGDRLPYFDGKSIYPLFTKANFHLLHIANEPLTDDQVNQYSGYFPFPIEVVENKIAEEWTKLGVRKEIFMLIRPDNYTALIFDDFVPDQLKKYLSKHFNI